MSDRDHRLREEVEQLQKQLRAALADRDLHYEVAQAARVGCAQAGEVFARRAEEAENAAAAARRATRAALAEAAANAEHAGKVYGRIRRLDDLLDQFEKQLPKEFLVAARQVTRPDFAELLGVGR